MDDHSRARELLRIGTGHPDAEFRSGQEAAILAVVERRGRLLVVQKTGWGKSFVYFIATKLLREAGAGPALLVSPLLALMRNQLAAATRMGVRAATIHSDNTKDWADIEDQVRGDEIDILLISPERLANEGFQSRVLARIANRIALLVVDEAHCISDWGHDFRPHYRLLQRIITTLPANLRVLATTATANARVMADLVEVLGPATKVSRGDLDRPSLSLQTIRLGGQAERLAWLAEHLPSLAGSGIVYTLTVRDAEQVSAWLKSRGLVVEAYSGQLEEGRAELEDALLANRLVALIATPALGMGFDKPDLAFVIHYQMPGSVVAYYQQVGRAGRALEHARAVLLGGGEDRAIIDYFIEGAFPSRAEVEAVLAALAAAPEGRSVPELLADLNLGKTRIDKTLALLSLESPAPIARQGSKWQLTAARLGEQFWERAARLTRLRREEQAEMQDYARLDTGHMEFLIRALDGEPGQPSGASLPPLPTTADPTLVREAIAFLKHANVVLHPRKQWPAGGLPEYALRGRIPESARPCEGRALSSWADAGWGRLVQQGKSEQGRFDDRLVDACVDLLRRWRPEPAPRWVTCIPSLRHPTLMPDFAERLAHALGLEFHAVLSATLERPEQNQMANSTQQARNVDGAFVLLVDELPAGPMLLLDDVIDSGWTMTVAAWLLREAGSDEVWPLALALAGYES
ncbi:RecQ family ATP-dependent DNA helicase [Nannocystaceae bacterium ST9]